MGKQVLVAFLLLAPVHADDGGLGDDRKPAFGIDPAGKSVTVTTAEATVRLTPWGQGVVRVEAAPGAIIPEKTSFAVVAKADPADWTLASKEGSVTLTSPRMSATVDRQTGLVSFFDATGKPLLTQTSWRFQPAEKAERDGWRAGATFARQPDEHFFGGGVIGDNFWQPKTEIPLQNDYLQMHIPVLYSSAGYGFFWDNSSRGSLRMDGSSVEWQTRAGDLADFYVMAGPSADEVVGEYRHLTGDAPLFPRWAYGFWFSKNKFDTQQQILDAAAKFRVEKIPVDLLVQDYFYWKPDKSKDDGENWGSHQFDPVRYPDPQAMIAQLHDQDHLRFMAVIWAKFDPDVAHAQELAQAGALLPPHHDWASPRLLYYDPFNPKGREIYGRQVMDSLFSLGVDAFWMDGAEPEMNMDKFAAMDTAAGPGSRVIDAFPLVHTSAVYAAQRKATADKRVVLLPRSAWAGEQRNGACSWTSDIKQQWSSLVWQIEGLQNYSICGLPYVTTDVGGYDPTPQADRELFVRWFEWGAFCPIFRVHGVGRPFPWEYGEEGSAILKKFDNLRYRLLPYIYSEAGRITFDHGTLLRPLVMDFRQDEQAIAQWDEFMFGPELLVCPVYKSNRDFLGTPETFVDKEGRAGSVTATYIKRDGSEVTAAKALADGLKFKEGAKDNQNGADRIRVEAAYTPAIDGALALQVAEPHAAHFPVTAGIDGRPVEHEPLHGDWQFPLFPFQAHAGVPVQISFETKMPDPGFQVVRVGAQPVSRMVYLPGPTPWYDFWTGEKMAGGTRRDVSAPLDTIPLYVRAGSILPLGPEVQYADEQPNGPIELRIYRGADGHYTLYQDAGDGYAYEKGQCAKIPITWDDAAGRLTFGACEGSYAGMPSKREFDVVWVAPHHGTGESPASHPDAVLNYDGHSASVQAPAE